MAVTREHITTLRREKVREYRNKGYNQRGIANKLKISLGLVNKDLQWMIKQANERIKNYTDTYLPAEHEQVLDTLDAIIKEMWEMEPKDNRELIQSRTLIKECAAMRLDLVGSSKVIDRATQFIRKQKELGRGLATASQNVNPLIEDQDVPSGLN